MIFWLLILLFVGVLTGCQPQQERIPLLHTPAVDPIYTLPPCDRVDDPTQPCQG